MRNKEDIEIMLLHGYLQDINFYITSMEIALANPLYTEEGRVEILSFLVNNLRETNEQFAEERSALRKESR